VVGRDFNAHSTPWDARSTEQCDPVFCEDDIDQNGLEIGNFARATHSWTRGDLEGKSIIDLTMVNRPIEKLTILAVIHATISDHQVIEWEGNVDKEEAADHQRVVRWNLAAIMEEDDEPGKKLWMELAKGRAHLDVACPEDEVEHKAMWGHETLRKVLDVTANTISICTKSKRWWNGDIKARRMTLGHEMRNRGRHSEEAGRAKAELRKSLRKSKSQMWSDYLQKLRGAEVWRAAKYVDPQVGATVEVQMDREGKHANTVIEKEEMLRLESYPLNDDEQDYELPPAASAHTKVTETAVKRTLYSQLVIKGPGPDKLSIGAVHLLWKWDKARIVGLGKVTISTGRHPAVGKRAGGVVIRTLGKDDYAMLMAYRTISLLSSIGMVLEKVVAELRSEEAERRGLLRDGQFGN
jgi:hypothetical protein